MPLFPDVRYPIALVRQPSGRRRVSNFLLIVMLFLVGHKWAGYVYLNRPITGLAMVAVGLAMVGVAILLGG